MLRPQTWYLVLAALLLVVVACIETTPLARALMLIASAVLAALTIPLYKNRKRQAQFSLLPMLLLFIWYVQLSMAAPVEGLGWYHALPLVSILLIFLARKGILRDEKLVRSLDRIR
jgi:phosphatidylserine synthase